MRLLGVYCLIVGFIECVGRGHREGVILTGFGVVMLVVAWMIETERRPRGRWEDG